MPLGTPPTVSLTKEMTSVLDTDDPICDSEEEKLLPPPVTRRRHSWRSHIHEALVFSFFFSYTVTMNCSSSLFFDRACVVYLNRTVAECKGNDSDLLDRSQIIANNYGLYGTLIRFIPSAILGFFVGPWSDKYGKKPPIFVATIGSVLSAAGMVWYVCVDDLPLYWAVLTSVPTGFTGGSISYLSCIYAMVSESTGVESRTLKYTLLELSLSLAVPVAAMTGGILFESYGYKFVYILAFATTFVPLVLLLLLRDEGRRLEASWTTKAENFFSFESLKENIRTIMKARGRNGRLQILLLCVSTLIITINYLGMEEILYFFCQKMYNWTLMYYSEVIACDRLISTAFVLGLVPLLTKILRVSDPWIGFVGVASLLAQQTVRAFANKPWIFFTSIALGLPTAIAPTAVRSIVSKLVEKDELSKIFALLAEMESLVPILASLVGTQVYNASVGFFPGLLLLVMGVFLIFPMAVFVWQARLPSVSETVDD